MEMRNLFVALYSNDNSVRRDAEVAYNNALGSNLTECVSFMLQTLASSAEVWKLHNASNSRACICNTHLVAD